MIDCIDCNATKEVCKASYCILIYHLFSYDLDQLNPFMPIEFPPLINWASPFPFKGCWVVFFNFSSNFKRNFKQ